MPPTNTSTRNLVRRESRAHRAGRRCALPSAYGTARASGLLRIGLEFENLELGFEMLGLGFEVWELGFEALELGFEVLGLGFKISGFSFEP